MEESAEGGLFVAIFNHKAGLQWSPIGESKATGSLASFGGEVLHWLWI